MTATYTFDVFSSLDGFGSASGGDWGGYWGKQGPELLDHRLALYGEEQRMVFGANTYRLFAQMLASSTEESEVRDPWVTRMVNLPTIIVSTTLEEPLDWVDGTVARGDAVDVVARLKEESEVPLRSRLSAHSDCAMSERKRGWSGNAIAISGSPSPVVVVIAFITACENHFGAWFVGFVRFLIPLRASSAYVADG